MELRKGSTLKELGLAEGQHSQSNTLTAIDSRKQRQTTYSDGESPQSKRSKLDSHENEAVKDNESIPEVVDMVPRKEDFDDEVSPNIASERTLPEPYIYVRNEDILAAAENIAQENGYESNSSDTDSDYNYVLDPASKRRKKDNPAWRRRQYKLRTPEQRKKPKRYWLSNDSGTSESTKKAVLSANERRASMASSATRTSAATNASRRMISPTIPSSKLQKLFTGYPDPNQHLMNSAKTYLSLSSR